MDSETILLHQFLMTPMPGAGGLVAPDPNEPVPEGGTVWSSWAPLTVVPMSTGSGTSLVVIWSRMVTAAKEQAKVAETNGLVVTPSLSDKKRLGIL